MSRADVFGGHDGLLCDLDGVVYTGAQALPGAVEALERLREAGVPIGFVTNNASRSSARVAQHLNELGLTVGPEQVFGSAEAGVDLLEEVLAQGPDGRAGADRPVRVLVVGSEHLRSVVATRGMEIVASAADRPDAVVQGFDPGLGWADLAEAAYAVEGGAVWVATNLDLSLPRPEGVAPGNGALVSAVAHATGRRPVAAGKPEPRLFHAAARALGLEHPLVVGDRLDTDVRGGNAAGFDTVLVLTGIDTAATAQAADAADRPTWVVEDLTALLGSPSPAAGPGPARG